MLMLTRKYKQIVELRDRSTGRVLCTVQVLEQLPSGEVRLGFDALPEIHIVRDNMKAQRNPVTLQEDDNRGNR